MLSIIINYYTSPQLIDNIFIVRLLESFYDKAEFRIIVFGALCWDLYFIGLGVSRSSWIEQGGLRVVSFFIMVGE